MNTLKERDALLEEQWKRFKKIPVNPDTEKIGEAIHGLSRRNRPSYHLEMVR